VGKLISLIERTREQLANATLTTATHEDVEKALRFVRAMAKAGEASDEIPLSPLFPRGAAQHLLQPGANDADDAAQH
jgi:hypothetical protein